MLKEYFEINEEILVKALDDSEFKNTSKILWNFYNKCKSIDEAIKVMDFQSNFYPCVILLRCQIEHFIIATYIWIQFRITEKDEIAKEYREEYLIHEVLKRLNYSKSNNISMSSKYAIAFQKILDILIEKKVLKQKDLETIFIKGNQFDIRKISKFFDQNLPLKYDNIIEAERIKSFLEGYNYFSSFVHGGPSADELSIDEYKTKIIGEEKDFIEWSSNIVGFLRILILYFLSMKDEKFESDFKIEMDKIKKTSV
jgi:hypothetical protein